MGDFRLCHVYLNAAKGIHRFHQPFKPYRHIVCDKKIRVHVQHSKRLLRPPVSICGIALFVSVISYIQISIPVNRDETHLMLIHVNRADHNGIAPVISLPKILIPGVHAKKSNIINPSIFVYRLRLFRFRNFFLDFLINSNLLRIYNILLHTIFPGGAKHDKQDTDRRYQHKYLNDE